MEKHISKEILFNSDKLIQERKYWLDKLSGIGKEINLPYDYSKDNLAINEFESLKFQLPNNIFEKLINVSSKSDKNLFVILLSGISLLINEYTKINEVVLTCPIYKQKQEDNLINTILILINKLDRDNSFKELLLQVRAELNQSIENQNFPIDIALQHLQKENNESSNLILHHMVVLENIHQVQSVYEVNNDLVFKFARNTDNISLEIIYIKSLYNEATIKLIANSVNNLFNEVLNNISVPLKQLDFMDCDEKDRVIRDFNNNQVDIIKENTIINLFERQVLKQPDKIAITFEGKTISYKMLNEKSNQVARFLIEHDVGSNEIVGIMIDRSIEMIIGIMGILKAGAAYMPLSVDYPKERIRYMVENSSAKLLLTQEEFIDSLGFHEIGININHENILKFDTSNLEKEINPDNLAYVIYTSGSTGNPKGAIISHGNVVNLVAGLSKDVYEKYIGTLNIALIAPFIFDASVQQIFGSLLLGHNLYIVPENTKQDGKRLLEYYNSNRIDISDGTPMHLSLILSACNYQETITSVKHFIIGGDKLKGKVVKEFFDKFPRSNFSITNVYGPTECCVDCTSYLITKENLKELDDIPIGQPMTNVQIYILDEDMRILPIGAIGEIYISGKGVGQGYLNNASLTHDRFVKNPFEGGEKLYKTGDIGRWTPEGNIRIIGRIDNQVKIRGYRIELGEIETKLLKHESIKQAVIFDKTDDTGEKYLCAFIVAEKKLIADEIRSYLNEMLPKYMIPSVFIQLDAFPITANGKIDKKALLNINNENPSIIEEDIATNEVELKLIEICKEVLSINSLSTKNNFFEIGGHSLKVTQFVSKINKELNVKITNMDIFKLQTIKKIAEHIHATKKDVHLSITKAEEKEYYEISSVQRRLYALQQLNTESIAYNMPFVIELIGQIDENQIEKATKVIINRHEALRTYFKIENGQVVQVINKNVDFKLDIINCLEDNNESYIKDKLREFIRPFNLNKGPLIRAGVLHLNNDTNILVFDLHHIVSDGISMEILTREFVDLISGKELKEISLQYKDYCEWQNKLMNSEAMRIQKEYWASILSGELTVLNLPYDYKRGVNRSYEGRDIFFKLDRVITEKLKTLAKESEGTLYMTLLAALNVLLSRYTDQEDIIVGTPIAARTHADLEDTVGAFVNTIVMRNYCDADICFEDFLKEVNKNSLEAFDNQDYPFENILEDITAYKEVNGNQIFNVAFTMHNIDYYVNPIEKFKVVPYALENSNSKFDLMLYAKEIDGEMNMAFEYSTELFKGETVERFVESFLVIINSIIENKKVKISEINVISEGEKNKLIYDFNDNEAEFPRDKTIQELFEEQVERMPENIAVVYEQERLTYRELNQRANQLARTLKENNVERESIVAILMDRSLDMIISILAVLKSGGAYLPINPTYPKERIKYMLEDSGSEVIIVQHCNIGDISLNKKIIDMNDENIFSRESMNLAIINEPQDIAYIIYTSGTTGKPKGAMIEHRNVVNLMKNNKMEFNFSEYDVWTMFHSFCFDFSVWEMYGALLYGGRLVMVSTFVAKDTGKFLQMLKDEEVTILNQTPTAFYNLVQEEMKCDDAELKIRYVIFGGEALKPIILKDWKQKYSNTKLINMYGITETTVHVTYKELSDEDIIGNISNIGKAIPNVTAYILDKNRALLPIGVTGELYVGGPGVGRGYLNKPELTIDRFIKSQFKNDEILYRSGDLARRLSNGDMEYLGRIDQQVKIRGYRVEPGEIENRLLKHELIKEATVIDRQDDKNNNYLCAYIVGTKELNTEKLRNYLSEQLPHYMIPSYFVQISEMPLTSNGKLNKKLLPDPIISLNINRNYEAPRNKVEKHLVNIWREVLGVGSIGIDDNFFNLGGDSIKAIQVSARLLQYGYKVDIKDIFTFPIIKQLSVKVRDEKVSISQEIVEGDVGLTPIQRWFFENYSENINHFNQSVMLFNRNGFNQEIVKKVFDKILEHHDVLRMAYKVDKLDIQQFNLNIKEQLYDFEIFDYKRQRDFEELIKKDCTRLQKSINVNKGPLIALGLFKTDDGDHLAIIIHHLIIDGISWRVLFEDFSKGYKQLLNNQQIRFQEKTNSYMEWAKGIKEYSRSKELLSEIAYWEQLEKSEIVALHYEQKDVDTAATSRQIELLHFSEEETEDILKNVNKAYNTEINDILLTSLAKSIKKYSNHNNILINLEGHGREQVFENINIMRTIGWFTTNYPVIFSMKDDLDLSHEIKNIKETLRRVPAKGIGYGILRYITNKELLGELEFKLKPQISFNYLGQFDEDIPEYVFEISNLSPGNNIAEENEHIYAIDINGMIKNKKLAISFNFDANMVKRETMHKFVEDYKRNLLDIIKHCTNKKESEVTPSDLGSNLVDIDELDEFMDELQNLLD